MRIVRIEIGLPASDFQARGPIILQNTHFDGNIITNNI